MGHPNPRFLAVARRAQPRPAQAPDPVPVREVPVREAKKKGFGIGWKFAAIVAGAGVLLWTLSTPTDDDVDEGGSPGGPRALPPPGQGQDRHGEPSTASMSTASPAAVVLNTAGGEGEG